jgi:hypothetical protein
MLPTLLSAPLAQGQGVGLLKLSRFLSSSGRAVRQHLALSTCHDRAESRCGQRSRFCLEQRSEAHRGDMESDLVFVSSRISLRQSWIANPTWPA